MTSLTVRNLDPTVKERLRARAAKHGRSMGEEVRRILSDAARAPEPRESLADLVRDLFGPEHGVELALPPRRPVREPPTFD